MTTGTINSISLKILGERQGDRPCTAHPRRAARPKAFDPRAPLCYTDFMTDQPPDDEAETPIQRALRLKRAAIDARTKPPRGGAIQRRQSAGVAAGRSKPWMKR